MSQTSGRFATDFIENGYLNLGSVVDKGVCTELLQALRSKQPVSPDMFLSEEAFDANPKYKDVNPIPGRNILEQFVDYTDKIESTPVVENVLTTLLGDEYYILTKKVICGVPETWIPEWLRARIQENPVNNLGPYVKPEYRNMTYFYGIDFHQDIIDRPGREMDFITLYVYLHDVDRGAAALHLLSNSHKLGVDKFPHNLSKAGDEENCWRYQSANTDDIESCQHITITGETGNVGLWHSCTIHGTQPNQNNRERLSLRYLIAKKEGVTGTPLDEMNNKMPVKAFETEMRWDLAEDGKPSVKKNYLYERYKNT